jgi:hypothetical protein
MKITKNKLRLQVPDNMYVPSIQNEIRDNLVRMGVSGLSIDIRYDVRTNIAMVRFTFNNQNYEMKVSSQKDVRSNLFAINKRIEYKARLHLLDIEPFDISVSPYLQIENQSGNTQPNFQQPKVSAHNYVVLGIPEYTNTKDLEKRYKDLVRTFHPDMALSSEAKMEFEKKMAEINQAWTEIKKERGI